MSRCFGCGYMWADLDDEGRPISLEYCHYDGPDDYAPCEQDDDDEYANEARLEEEAAKEEIEYEMWLESLPEEQRPTNAHEYVEAWKWFQNRYEQKGIDMERFVKFIFGTQILEIYVDDIPEDATPSEIRDMALDIFEQTMTYEIWEA